jgi:anti-anti-sigma factor
MGRLMTRLTRDTNSTWLLELIGVKDREVFRQMAETEMPAIMNILEQTEVCKLVVDLTAAQEFDSRGLQFLCRMHKQLAERNIPLILRNPNAHLRQILRIMQFDQLFKIEYGDIMSQA